jgi:hypothetical protein
LRAGGGGFKRLRDFVSPKEDFFWTSRKPNVRDAMLSTAASIQHVHGTSSHPFPDYCAASSISSAVLNPELKSKAYNGASSSHGVKNKIKKTNSSNHIAVERLKPA